MPLVLEATLSEIFPALIRESGSELGDLLADLP
jgi:hypothetical protein